MSLIELPQLIGRIDAEAIVHHLKNDVQIGQDFAEEADAVRATNRSYTSCGLHPIALHTLCTGEGVDQQLDASHIPQVLQQIRFTAIVIGVVSFICTVFARVVPDASWTRYAKARTSA
jgi:hypothetical protein